MKDVAVKESAIYKQIEYWRRQKQHVVEDREKANTHPFITISREYGCGGFDIAVKLIDILNKEYHATPIWAAYDKQILDKITSDLGLTEALTETLTHTSRSKMTDLFQTTFSKFPSQVAVYRKLAEVVRTLAINGHVVIVGRAGNIITREMPYGLHVRIVAPMSYKVTRIAAMLKVSQTEAREIIEKKQIDRESFIKNFLKFDPDDPHNYDLVINNENFAVAELARLIIDAMKRKGIF
ncbi:MAG: cytidylate kinase-like family protein [Spirochaetota bacterium]